jgi:hypothetical protein
MEHIVAWSVCPTAQENNKTQGRRSPVAAPRQPATGLPMVKDRRCPWLMPAGQIAACYARGTLADARRCRPIQRPGLPAFLVLATSWSSARSLNFRFLAHAVLSTDETVARMHQATR